MSKLPLLRACDLGIGYGRRSFLQGISFDVNEGDFIGLVGPNGAGKSTLLSVLLGTLKPVTGKVETRANLRLGFVPQRAPIDAIYPIRALEAVRFGGMGARSGALSTLRAAPKEDALQALDQMGIKPLANKLMRDLSGGQQQRVQVARALVRKPHLLVLDEPTTGMDLPAQDEFLQTLTQWNQNHGTTLIVVLHEVSLVAAHASRLAFINKDADMFTIGDASKLLCSEHLSQLYGAPMQIQQHQGRYIIDRGRA